MKLWTWKKKMLKSKENKIALTVGIYFALLHLIWAILVAAQVGQKFLDLTFPMHFVRSILTTTSFNIVNAVMIVIWGFFIGYVGAWLFIAIYKMMKVK